jgi:hypothetical protein
MTNGDNTFVTITNHDIFEKLEKIEEKMELLNKRSFKSTVLSSIALSLVLTCITLLIIHVAK